MQIISINCQCKDKQISMSAKVLIVEDDTTLNKQLEQLLENAGFDTVTAYDGDDGLTKAISLPLDLILLDVSLPEKDGYSVLRTLRQTRVTPVIMLTAHGAEEERILGLKSGADDYLSKPFNFTELLLRIEAILRRTLPQTSADEHKLLTRHGIKLDKLKQTVTFSGQEIPFTPIQFKLLWILMQNPNQTLSKPQLYRLVLEKEFSRYDRSLDMHMSRVRRKLVTAGLPADHLQTVHGTGYLLL